VFEDVWPGRVRVSRVKEDQEIWNRRWEWRCYVVSVLVVLCGHM